MKVLHTSDWHLGARLGVHDRLPDQRIAVRSVIEQAREHEPDLILHTGDLFDTFNPGHETLRLALASLNGLAAIGPTIVVGGNHDSYPLLQALSELSSPTRGQRVRLISEPQAIRVGKKNRQGTAWVACVPFITHGKAIRNLTGNPNQDKATYADYIGQVNSKLWTTTAQQALTAGGNNPETLIYAAHLYVTGARPGKSERRVTVSEDYVTRANQIPKGDYAAFGHIHDPQVIDGSGCQARYAGSLIPLDFGEIEQTKQSCLVEIDDEWPRTTRVTELEVRSGRPLTDFQGTLTEMQQAAGGGNWNDHIVRVVVQSDDRIYDLSSQVLQASPKALVHEIVNQVQNVDAMAITDYDYEPVVEPPMDELFIEWRKTRASTERSNDETARALFNEALRNAQAPGTTDFGIGPLTEKAENVLKALTRLGPGDQAGR